LTFFGLLQLATAYAPKRIFNEKYVKRRRSGQGCAFWWSRWRHL